MDNRNAFHIIGMQGLGDNIYQRPLIKVMAPIRDVYLSTPWPELYSDLRIKFIQMNTGLRTQRKNLARQPQTRWSKLPTDKRLLTFRPHYMADLTTLGMVRSLQNQYPLKNDSYEMDLPDFGYSPLRHITKPIALVRPATLRMEWRSDARNCKQEYVQEAIDALKKRDYFVVSVADVEASHEYFVEFEPGNFDVAFHYGELSFVQLMALVQQAKMLVGPVGWICPAGVAAKKYLYVIFGGRGGHNAPELIFDDRMDLSKVGWSMPDTFCRCTASTHSCNKTITDFKQKFFLWLDNVVRQ